MSYYQLKYRLLKLDCNPIDAKEELYFVGNCLRFIDCNHFEKYHQPT